jgi:hypothetical protein
MPRSSRRSTCSPAVREYFLTVCQIMRSCMHRLGLQGVPRVLNGRKRYASGSPAEMPAASSHAWMRSEAWGWRGARMQRSPLS